MKDGSRWRKPRDLSHPRFADLDPHTKREKDQATAKLTPGVMTGNEREWYWDEFTTATVASWRAIRDSPSGAVEFPVSCGDKRLKHRVRISIHGRVSFLDHSDAEYTSDLLSVLGQEERPTCLTFRDALRVDLPTFVSKFLPRTRDTDNSIIKRPVPSDLPPWAALLMEWNQYRMRRSVRFAVSSENLFAASLFAYEDLSAIAAREGFAHTAFEFIGTQTGGNQITATLTNRMDGRSHFHLEWPEGYASALAVGLTVPHADHRDLIEHVSRAGPRTYRAMVSCVPLSVMNSACSTRRIVLLAAGDDSSSSIVEDVYA